tara:strand:- start:237 stop:1139 length:903 start_codon:yes stop_codon:yes gene_type:complete
MILPNYFKQINLSNTTKGILNIILAALFFSMMATFIKLSLIYHNVVQVIFFRSLFASLILFFFYKLNFFSVNISNYKLHIIRTFLGLSAMFCTFTALQFLPLSNVSIILFSKIFFIIPLTVYFLGEKIDYSSLFYIFIGFTGIIIILGFEADDNNNYFYYFYALLGSFLIASIKILLKKLSFQEDSLSIQLWFSLLCCILLFVPFLINSTSLNYQTTFYIFLATVFSLFAQYFTIEGLKIANPIKIMPFDFARVIFATILGILFFSEEVKAYLFIGALIVIFSGIKLIKKNKTPKSNLIK